MRSAFQRGVFCFIDKIIFMTTHSNSINAGLDIKEPNGGIRFGTDALLLAHFMLPSAGKKGLDIGTGSGVIPLLYLSQNRSSHITGVEIQKEYADCASQNAVSNGFNDRFDVICGDINNCRRMFKCGQFDFVCSNPPYHKVGSGLASALDKRDDAFRENLCTLEQLAEAASWALKSGGRFFAVYRPERLAEMICELARCRIETKRVMLVMPDSVSKPSLVLIEGRKDGKIGLEIMPPLYIFGDPGHKVISQRMSAVYDTFAKFN